MASNDVTVVLLHGAWADGSSWSKIILPLATEGVTVSAPPLPLTSFADDVAALERALERMPGPVVLAGRSKADLACLHHRRRAASAVEGPPGVVPGS